MKDVKCEYCGKMYSKYGIKNHINILHLKIREAPRPAEGIWNKGLTKDSDARLKKANDTYKQNFLDGKFKGSFSGKQHKEESKQKISQSRINYLNDNPDKVPYKLNHYSKGPSYPELYFEELFKKEKIYLVKEYQISKYQLDFADIDSEATQV